VLTEPGCGYVAPYPSIDPPGPDNHWCPVCTSTCLEIEGAHWCGDTITDAADGEDCDDGNAVDGDGCSTTCQDECGTWTCEIDRIAVPAGQSATAAITVPPELRREPTFAEETAARVQGRELARLGRRTSCRPFDQYLSKPLGAGLLSRALAELVRGRLVG